MAVLNLDDLMSETRCEVESALETVEWAEEEIRKAQKRFPDRSDVIFHAFSLVRPPQGVRQMTTESVYRAYARELLDRVGRGEDTREGTAVEVCVGLANASLEAPLSHEGVGLYARMWQAAGLPDIAELTSNQEHYEAISGPALDEHEAYARKVCRRPERVLGEITCGGLHHGERVECVYAGSR